MAGQIESILESTKKALGLGSDYDYFDPEIIMHINSVFSTLQQLGVGPDAGFMINDETAEWDEYLGTDDPNLNSVRSYMALKLRLLFDLPATSFAISAYQDQVKEYEWRFSVYRDSKDLKTSKL